MKQTRNLADINTDIAKTQSDTSGAWLYAVTVLIASLGIIASGYVGLSRAERAHQWEQN